MENNTIRSGFRKRDTPLNVDYRPLYKLSIISLILGSVCRGNKSSLNKLHFFIWALKSELNMSKIRMAAIKNSIEEPMTWGVEPALNKALAFSIAEKIVSLNDDKYTLTEKGKDFFNIIMDDEELFTVEKKFLKHIGKNTVTEMFINTLTDRLLK